MSVAQNILHSRQNSQRNLWALFQRIRARFQQYRSLSKSGIVILVLVTTCMGFFLGTGDFSFRTLMLTLAAMFFLASGSAALNQIQEVELDRKMARTAERPLPSGQLSLRAAWIAVWIGISLGLFLFSRVNTAVLFLGWCAIFSYNVLYTLWWKPRYPFAAIPGAIPGALPVLMGYVASSGELWSAPGFYLFSLLFYWQMPHFWCLALKYSEDYEGGGIPTLPVARGQGITLFQITLWTVGYLALADLAPLFFPFGWTYFVPCLALNVFVLYQLIIFLKKGRTRWLRFFLAINFSLVGFFALMVIDYWGDVVSIASRLKIFFESFFG